ncbi:MAG: SGNH/GDSL hydrolase family protein [Candidatus Lokiarchaeota archaeon]|nr:SGNH/GDSL hydrolase family protein [Candidatus Lokiarchaeota archaeon]
MSSNPFAAPEELRKAEAPPWKSPVIVQEPVLLFSVGGVLEGSLLFEPESIVAIEAWDEAAGRFDRVSSGALKDLEVRPKPGGVGGRLLVHSKAYPHLSPGDVYQPLGSPLAYPSTRDKKSGLLFSEKGWFHQKSILVTYKHGEAWTGQVPRHDASKLPGLQRVLAGEATGRKSLDLLVLGDSISTGANCSASMGLFPRYHGYPDLVAGLLQARLPGVAVRLANESLGGASSDWGKKTLQDRVDGARGTHPGFRFDLTIIAFGANDAGGRKPARKYIKNIEAMMQGIARVNPSAEFLVVASSMMNDLWIHGHNDVLLDYQKALHAMASKMGASVAIADATQLWKDVLARKPYYDLTGNGLNHPNDFGHRLYAHVLGAVLGIL